MIEFKDRRDAIKVNLTSSGQRVAGFLNTCVFGTLLSDQLMLFSLPSAGFILVHKPMGTAVFASANLPVGRA